MLAHTDLRALSIRQPWAEAILTGAKQIENRTWSTSYRGLLVLHTGVSWDRTAPQLPQLRQLPDLPTGAHIGVVDLVGVHHDGDGRCGENCLTWGSPGCFHWEFSNPRRFDRPVPARGLQRLFRVTPALVNS